MSILGRVEQMMRSILAKIRRRLLKFLGINELVTHNLLVGPAVDIPVGEAFQRLMDRISILESHVNWRLYGLPATVGNIKLEQTGILANSLDLEQLINKLAPVFCNQNETELAKKLGIKFNAETIIVASSMLKSDKHTFPSHVILDTEDLFLPTYNTLFHNADRCFHAPVLTVLAATPTDRYESIWLSNVCERVHPLKALLILKHALRCKKSDGIIAGYISKNTNDPRIIKLFDISLFDALKIEGATIEMHADGGFTLKN